jgi:PAS domain S-box-containing protein
MKTTGKSEMGLWESEDRLQLLFRRMPIGLIVWSPDFKALSWNPAAERIFGYSAQEAIGKHPYDLIVSRKTQPHVDVIWQRLLEGDTTAHSINENLTKDGRTIICEWHNTPIREPDGTIAGAIAMVQDITERKQNEEALRESRNLLQSIVENAPIRVFWKDTELRYLGGNTLFAQDAGLGNPAELVGKDDYQLAWRDQADLYRADDRSVIDSNTPKIGYEEPGTRPDGKTLRLRTSKVPLHDVSGRTIGVLGIYDDITRRKQIEEELERSRQQHRELSLKIQDAREEERISIAHRVHDEMGALLTAISFDVAWLSRRLSTRDPDIGGKIRDIEKLVRQCTDMANAIQNDLHPAVLDRFGIVAAIEAEAEDFAQRTGIQCPVESIDEGGVPAAKVIITAFRVFQEALNNVLKHAHADLVKVTIHNLPGRLSLTIHDNGVGFREHDLKKPGTYGLLGMKERVAQFGGEFRIIGTPDHGTTIHVTIPC